MNDNRFDALVRTLAAAPSRRSLLAAGVSGVITSLLPRIGLETEAGCKRVGAKCRRNGNCCAGGHCRHDRCRCKQGWTTCGGDKLCRNLASDPANCGACGQTCSTGCCAGGVCRELCNGACCADCFIEATAPLPDGDLIDGTEACCAPSSICSGGTSDPGDDFCCWPDEVCLDGNCCCNGCEGTVVCGGGCCPGVSCCGGQCCGPGQVCARTQPNKPRTCVSADRSCATSNDCFEDETCWGGICCSGNRLCFHAIQLDTPVCCPLGKHCDEDSGTCCSNGITCGTTGKKVRVRY